MIKQIIIFGLFAIACLSCKNKPVKISDRFPVDSSKVAVKPPNIDSVTQAKKDDSLEQAFENGEIVYASIIKLHEHGDGYVDMDTTYGVPTFLLRDSCERYFRYARKMIPPDEVKVYDLVWGIKEIKQEGEGGGWNGYHGVFSRIEERPSWGEQPIYFYTVSIKRLYENREGTVFPIRFLQVWLHPKKILVIDIDGEYVPLAKWRKLPDGEK